MRKKTENEEKAGKGRKMKTVLKKNLNIIDKTSYLKSNLTFSTIKVCITITIFNISLLYT